jgi:hypothetical protein
VSSVTLPDVELAVRTWLRSVPSITQLVATRSYVDMPHDAVLPAIAVNRIGGSVDAATPLDGPLLSFDCWGTTRPQAQQIARALAAEIWGLDRPTPMGAGAVALAGQVQSLSWQPDDGPPLTPRFVLTAVIVMRAA